MVKLWTTFTGNPGLSERPEFFPQAIPENLANQIQKIHANPAAWWVGQLLKYIMQYTHSTQNFLDSEMTRLGFRKPIVGVHVRRTDKVTDESPLLFQPLDAYMKVVDEYFTNREVLVGDVDKRRIFLATDDPTVLQEAKEKYPNYEIIADIEGAKTAQDKDGRYSRESFDRILLDIYLLANSDYLVCTFSSEVGRLAYELMQTLHVDASNNFFSLDYIYFYNEQRPQYYKAVLPHMARNEKEFSFVQGEIIKEVKEMIDNLGLFSAIKNETQHKGMIPRFKVERMLETVNFPVPVEDGYIIDGNGRMVTDVDTIL